MTTINDTTKGLSSQEIKRLQRIYGENELFVQKQDNFLKKIIHVISEPMFLLLIFAALIYFIIGEPTDAAVMLIFVIGIISIDVIQEWKTDKTLEALKDLTAPHIKVMRDGEEKSIASTDLVPGDLMIIQEGVKIPADGTIIKCNDLSVDESTLTGEAEAVWKVSKENYKPSDDYWKKDYCYAGTFVVQGSAVVLVKETGTRTEYGKIGLGIAEAPHDETPLQKQTRKLVNTCAIIAGALFVMVVVITWFNISNQELYERITESILSGITLAMAMIPEEFPVILTVFLSMGAWRLAKKNSLVRKLPSVETLGAISVLCVDKTGTITMNQMKVQETYVAFFDEFTLNETMGMACETETYDPMEKAMLEYCAKLGITKEHLFGGKFITEYPFTNELKMMGHVWQRGEKIIVTVKGSSESVLAICDLTGEKREIINNEIENMSKKGLRVIAVAREEYLDVNVIPEDILDCKLTLCGLIGLEDPPRENVKSAIENCTKAGVRVVMITGDSGIIASAIAKKVGIPNSDNIITGDKINEMSDDQLSAAVKSVSVFSRVIPEHKMRIVKAFKENGQIVAMTGDGVNDAPALKYADIGVAMGKRGSEVSREASDLILMDDNFTVIVDTIKDGRRIYDNIRKAIGYVFTIHIPIALSALLAPILGISPASLFLLPFHVVLLELVIDPTCAIVLERQPAEENIMERQPRSKKDEILSKGILIKSIVQGLVIFSAAFGSYYYLLMCGENTDVSVARSMGIAILMISNIFLVLVNSSEYDFAFQSFLFLAKDWVMWLANFATLSMLIIVLYTPLSNFLKLAPLSFEQFFIAIGIAMVAVFWYEIVKLFKKIKKKS